MIVMNDITGTCTECNEKIDIDNVLCPKCIDPDNSFTYKDIESALVHAYVTDHAEDRECIEFTNNETEKEIQYYIDGIKFGRMDALYWVAEYFGDDMVSLWEQMEKDKNKQILEKNEILKRLQVSDE